MILVTGGTGFLGSHLLYELIKRNLPVRAIYRTSEHRENTREIFSFYDSGELLFEKIEWQACDINDNYTLHEILDKVEYIFHTAGFVSFNDSDKIKLNRINVKGTANIVNASLEKGIQGLCFVSSIASLGELAPGIPVDESVIWAQGRKASAYSKSKFLAEMEVWRGMSEGLNAVIVNPSVIVGPGMWLGPAGNLWKSVQEGLKYYTDGSTGYVDVRDVANNMVWLYDRRISGERFILNSDHLNNRDFLVLLAKFLGKRPPDVKVTPFLAGLALAVETARALLSGSPKRFTRRIIRTAGSHLLYSADKFISLSGHSYIPIETSLKDAIEVFRAHQEK